MTQTILTGSDWTERLSAYLADRGVKKLLLVCGRSYDRLPIREEIEGLPAELVRYGDFAPNPKYEEVCEGVKAFRSEGCDGILAIGGGSAMDVAKCVKLYSWMDPEKNYLEQEPADTAVPLIAVPTTAGTGSESTRFAVVYYRGVKQSVSHPSIRPDCAVLEPAVLEGLPDYQRKCTMLDALCQGIESWWSVNSTAESVVYSRRAIRGIITNWEGYILRHEAEAAEKIMLAANYAGRAINITQTTAPHAMSYKLTSLYKLPHGHAAALCLPAVWEHMLGHMEDCIDSRGPEHLKKVFRDIAGALECESPAEAAAQLRELLGTLDMRGPVSENREQDIEMLTRSVNPLRLKNNPVVLDSTVLRALYEGIVR